MAEARILLYDEETAPIQGYTWTTWEANVIHITQHRQIMSIGYKWLGEKKIHYLDIPSCGGKKAYDDNTKMLEKFRAVIAQADFTVAHNGIKFDDRRLNADLVRRGLKPLPPRKSIDTLRIAKRYFDFESNRLDALGEILKVGRKVKHEGFPLWLGCIEGDAGAWKRMKKYCIQDVALLEKVYLKLRGFHHTHPDLTNYTQEWACKACQSSRLTHRGFSVLKNGKKQRYQCNDCGSWSVGKMIKNKK